MTAAAGSPREEEWTLASAESLLASMPGVISSRIVTRPGGEIIEIHMLTTFDVSPKQTVRNVESALLAHHDLEVDHRKISVAQTSWQPDGGSDDDSSAKEKPADTTTLRALPLKQDAGTSEDRILFMAHQVQSERSHLITMRVDLQWKGQRHRGEASGTDLPRTRLELVANATLKAVERALSPTAPDQALALDGVKVIDAFDRRYVLTAVNALTGHHVTRLSGAANIEESPDRAVILATLQATDRWVRGRV